MAKRKKSRALAKTRTRTVVKTRYRTRSPARRRRRGRSRSSSGVGGVLPYVAAAGVAGYLIGNDASPLHAYVAKIPGAKTFGTSAAAGVALLAANKFVKPNRYLKLAGYACLAHAAFKLGTDKFAFKWVGDDDYIADYDDVGDDDDGMVADVGEDD